MTVDRGIENLVELAVGRARRCENFAARTTATSELLRGRSAAAPSLGSLRPEAPLAGSQFPAPGQSLVARPGKWGWVSSQRSSLRDRSSFAIPQNLGSREGLVGRSPAARFGHDCSYALFDLASSSSRESDMT